MLPTLHIQLLGEFRLVYGDQPVTSLESPRLQSLLAYLLLHRDAPQSRQRLAFLLFPDSTESQARTNLRKLVHLLRKALPDADHFLLADSQSLQWRADAAFTLDVAEFEEAATEAISSTPLRDATNFYRGDLLLSCYEDWILPERERLRRMYIQALERLIILLENEEEYREAIGYAERMLRQDPLREDAYRHLMRLHALSGDRAGVLRVYQTCIKVLKRELGAEVSPATREAYEQVVKMEIAPAHYAELARKPRSHNLPFQLTSFIGREEEIANLRQLLSPQSDSRSRTRLLTLTGAGGCGKTRLAIEVAHSLVDAYQDGIWLVELAPLPDPTLVTQAVAPVLGVREEPRRTLVETLADYLEPKELLLILDNCEHLLAACGQLAETLLHVCPKLQIVATSRERLNIAGETTWLVPSLSLPDSAHLDSIEELQRSEAILLFIERAASVLPTFELNRQNAARVVQICKRLDGIPLAIELAAARVNVLTVDQIAERLDDRFGLLVGGSQTALPKHQALRATMDWSYQLLSEPERILYRRLSVFAGGFTLNAAEAVCSDGEESKERRFLYPADILELLAQLVDKSLVTADTVRQPSTDGRYRMLETIRQYAHERLFESGETEHIRDRHLDFFLNIAETAKPRLRGPEQLVWLNLLEVEHENLRLALQWSLESSQTLIALRLADALFWFWLLRVHMNEGIARMKSILALPEATGRTVARAKALCTAGHLHWAQATYAEARPLEEEALAIGRELDDKWSIATALHFLGPVVHRLGDSATAQSYLEEGLTLWRQLGDAEGITLSLTFLGDVVLDQGDYQRAQRLYEEAATLQRQIQDTLFLGYTLRRLAQLALYRRDHENATMLCTESLKLNREARNTRGIAACLVGLAGIAASTGEWLRAAKLLGAVQALLDSIRAQLLHADLVQQEHILVAVRAELDQERWMTTFTEGHAMTIDQAIDYALKADNE